MRVLVAAGAAVAVAATGVTAALLAAPGGVAPATAAVTSALTQTSSESYSFSLDSSVQTNGHDVHSDVVSGAFDPRHELGTELLTTSAQQRPVRAQIRFVGKYVYTWVSPGSGLGTVGKGKPWNKALIPPVEQQGAQGINLYGFVSDQPVSPAELSGLLRSAGAVRDAGPASGPGWTGTRYTFTAGRSDSQVSGTAYVDQHGRVRRLVTITTEEGITTDRSITFGDFGAPVSVTMPSASQVKFTDSPYWGFYF
jgi:hypothetical protein